LPGKVAAISNSGLFQILTLWWFTWCV